MRVITRRTLQTFWESHADAEEALREWYALAERAVSRSPHDITTQVTCVSILENSRVCFNIKGNTYRLIVAVDYKNGYVLVKWIGTHAEYSKLSKADVKEVGGT